jgi:hypothetical protein
MVRAIRFEKTGGPEVLTWQQVSVDKPWPGQVRLKHTGVGLNYIDTYQRSGLYTLGDSVRKRRDWRRRLEDTHPMELDHEACYRAISTRDARFDGRIFTAVRTTNCLRSS